ncbi:MAG TPA: Lrp/AsnC ligand binding domain-containing protein, partial [Anaerolineae bacterium]|nr:Lrp/AsnC ligand binding domain-containing protein [Anaerolineae bacterium]
TAFLRLSVGATDEYVVSKNRIRETCLAEPDVIECHGVAGEDCYVLKVRVANPQELERLIERIRSQGRIARSVTSIVLTTFKETAVVAFTPEA